MSNGKSFRECMDCRYYMQREYAFPCSKCESTGYRPENKPSYFEEVDEHGSAYREERRRNRDGR